MKPEGGPGAGGELITPGPAARAFEEALARFERDRAAERLWDRVVSFWLGDPRVGRKFVDRHVWLTCA